VDPVSDVKYPNKTEASIDTGKEVGLLLFTLATNGVLPGSNGTTIRHNTHHTK
jgi:hypothetical protein